ncbi:MAG: DUF1206 domain-containing protein [Sphingobacteriales bacterium]|nr:MAG: DUF1206 domain-containing protein [Sphingobacteriales bacterium]
MKRLARFGLAAKGIVYLLSGVLALMGALSIGNHPGKDADKSGVFSFVYEQPMGKALLAAIALGLLCYAAWRLIQGIRDTERKGTDFKGLAKRGSYIFRGLLYLSVAIYAGKMLLYHTASKGDSNQKLAGELMDKPFGQVLVGAIAIVMFISGIVQLFNAFSGKYKKYVQEAHHKNHITSLLISAGKLGYAARGIVWFIIGWLFLKAALNASPGEAGGSGDVFEWLQSWDYGDALMAIVAAGLVCYGIFMFLRARYQPINA